MGGLLSFSARLHLLANNSSDIAFCAWHRPNVASRILALCERRLSADWRGAFGHPILLLETFVDPRRHPGTVYRAAKMSENSRRAPAVRTAAPAAAASQ